MEVVFTYYSESGDWNLVRDCFYRPNGKLAKTEESYGAFAPAECTATTDTYYDEHGVAFGRERHFYKLGTKSPIKPVEVYEPDEPVYKNARDLPFRWK